MLKTTVKPTNTESPYDQYLIPLRIQRDNIVSLQKYVGNKEKGHNEINDSDLEKEINVGFMPLMPQYVGELLGKRKDKVIEKCMLEFLKSHYPNIIKNLK